MPAHKFVIAIKDGDDLCYFNQDLNVFTKTTPTLYATRHECDLVKSSFNLDSNATTTFVEIWL